MYMRLIYLQLIYLQLMYLQSHIYKKYSSKFWFCNYLKPKSVFVFTLYMRIQFVPRSKHTVLVTKTNQLVLNREIIAVCFEIHTKQNTYAEFVIVKPDITWSDL
jgi:hypothetical protein